MQIQDVIQLSRTYAIAFSLGTAALCTSHGLGAKTADANDPPRQPPAEAINACKALSSGKSCSFSTPQGSVKGSCWAPEGKPLACKPSNAPGMPPDGPKQ